MASRRCPECRARSSASARFCRSCGLDLGEVDDKAPSIAPPSSVAPPSRDWREMRGWLWLYGFLLLSTIVFSFLLRLEVAPQAELEVFIVSVDALVIGAVAWRHRAKLLPHLRTTGLRGHGALWTLGGGVTLFVVGQAYFALIVALGVREMSYWATYDEVGWPWWSAALLIVAFPAIFEEIAFRGLILSGLDRLMKPREALVVQAAAFSVLHLAAAVFVSHFGIGLLFGFLRRKTGSLVPGIVLHALWNSWVLIEERLA